MALHLVHTLVSVKIVSSFASSAACSGVCKEGPASCRLDRLDRQQHTHGTCLQLVKLSCDSEPNKQKEIDLDQRAALGYMRVHAGTSTALCNASRQT